MSKESVKSRLRAICAVLGAILWRSFGLFVKYLHIGLMAGMGIAAATQDLRNAFWGFLIQWIPSLAKAWSEIGEEIARTGRVTNDGINRGFRLAVEMIEQAEAKAAKDAVQKATDKAK